MGRIKIKTWKKGVELRVNLKKDGRSNQGPLSLTQKTDD